MRFSSTSNHTELSVDLVIFNMQKYLSSFPFRTWTNTIFGTKIVSQFNLCPWSAVNFNGAIFVLAQCSAAGVTYPRAFVEILALGPRGVRFVPAVANAPVKRNA